MSKLGSLFGGGSADNDSNDSLRYQAPREPSKNKPAPTTTANATASSTTANTTTAPAAAAKVIQLILLFRSWLKYLFICLDFNIICCQTVQMEHEHLQLRCNGRWRTLRLDKKFIAH